MAIKVLRIINRFNLGGPTYNVAYLTKYLAPEFETILVGGMKDETEESSDYIIKKLGIQAVVIPEMKRPVNPFEDHSAYKKIKDIIEEFKPDIVHTHAAKAGALGRMAAIKCGVPVIVHTFHGHVFHSYFNTLTSKFFRAIERYLAKKSSAIVVISERQRQELVEFFKVVPPEKAHIIPLGFDLERFRENKEKKRTAFREKYYLSEDELAIGIIGRLVPVKNHRLFLKGIQFLKKNTSKKIRAFIIGDGEERFNIENSCREMGLIFKSIADPLPDEDVIFTSWIKDADWALSGLDILCLTSFNEGTPVSLVEAQAAGKPIVTTNVGGIENIVLPGKTALLSDIADEQKYCDNLLQLVNDEEMRKMFSENGWDFIREKFHYNRLVADMRELYYKILSERKK